MAAERSCTHYFRFTLGGAAERQRCPALERLLAYADGCIAVRDWRADAFRRIAPVEVPMPGIAAAALFAERGAVRGATALMATPVHYAAEMSSVRMTADGMLSLQQAEASELAADFNRVWRTSGSRMISGLCANLYCVLDEALETATRDPEDVLGEPIEGYLPAGSGGRRLRQLMSEIEMWLFDHPVNRSRTGVPAVTGLWLWGGGPVLESLPPVSGWTAGNDVFFRAFGAKDAPDSSHGATSGVAVIHAQPGAADWSDAGQGWLARSDAEWRAGRLERLELSAGGRCCSVTPRGRWRFWRRARPWWEHFE